MPADPFTNSVGHFGGLYETRDYMRARFALADRIGLVAIRLGAAGPLYGYVAFVP